MTSDKTTITRVETPATETVIARKKFPPTRSFPGFRFNGCSKSFPSVDTAAVIAKKQLAKCSVKEESLFGRESQEFMSAHDKKIIALHFRSVGII